MQYAYFADYWIWANQSKVTFDGENKLILINPGVTSINIEADIYSNWKEWLQLYDYAKFLQALRSTGGDPLPSGDFLGGTFFLMNGWKIRTWEGDHSLVVVGNIYSEDGLAPFVPTLDHWNILVTSTVSNLIDKISSDAVASLVWEQLSANHKNAGTKGKELADALKILKILLANA